MKNAAAVALRADYKTLTLVVEGLMDIIFNQRACNILTMARLAEEAKSSARRLASELERIIFTETPTVAEKVIALSLFARLQVAILLLLAGLSILHPQKVKNRGSISATPRCTNGHTIYSGTRIRAPLYIVF